MSVAYCIYDERWLLDYGSKKTIVSTLCQAMVMYIVVYCKVESIVKSRVGHFAYSLDDVVASM